MSGKSCLSNRFEGFVAQLYLHALPCKTLFDCMWPNWKAKAWDLRNISLTLSTRGYACVVIYAPEKYRLG